VIFVDTGQVEAAWQRQILITVKKLMKSYIGIYRTRKANSQHKNLCDLGIKNKLN
jgi:hypothetical protein